MNNLIHQNRHILITIDVEDWFQVENFKPYIPFSTWDSRELRVEQNVHKLLDLFDSIKLDNLTDTVTKNTKKSISAFKSLQKNKNSGAAAEYKIAKRDYSKLKIQNSNLPRRVKATFFILGWVAERLPNMVKEVRRRGHEVASHGYKHELCSRVKAKDLKQDLIKSKKLLEDITGFEVFGYRAPSFSINNDILKIIEDCGYRYDSSYNSFGLHGRYGKINLNGQPKKGIAYKLSDNFYELPISNLKLGIQKAKPPSVQSDVNSKLKIQNSKFKIELPWGGGGYFRLIPNKIFEYGMRYILENENAILFYLHPWELDPYQPRVKQAKWSYQFRHYNNLHKTMSKLNGLLKDFSNYKFTSCSEYIGN